MEAKTKGIIVLTDIIMNTPFWLLVLGCVCLFLGWWQSRAQVCSKQVLILPACLLLVASLWFVVQNFGWAWSALLAWLVGAAATIGFNWKYPKQAKGVFYVVRKRRFILPKNWKMLGLAIGLFIIGYLAYLAYSLQAPIWVIAAVSVLLGGLGGWFIGRLLVLIRSKQVNIIAPTSTSMSNASL